MSDGDKMSLDDYDILSFLGEGGFARVYKAKSKKNGQEVAIKMIEKETTKARRMVARVRKEVEIHSRLKHPSILEIYDYDEDNKYVYLVLELCHNGEFLHYLDSQGGVLTEDEARKVIRQVVEGMQYLQRHHIMHRDLKLSNLLLTQDMNIKIADFGLAIRLTEPEEKHFTMCGTPNYMAPEVAKKEAHGPEVDVWSLGCMLYTMLVGTNPFDTDTIRGTLDRVIQAEYHLPSDLSLEASDLIQRLLRKNPNERLLLKDVLCHPFMRGKSVATQDTIQMSEISVDSGCGTFATTLGSSHSSSNGHGHPTTAFPSKAVGSRISKEMKQTVADGILISCQRVVILSAISDTHHHLSGREMGWICDLWEPMTSNQHKSNRDVIRNSSEAAIGPSQFDPHRYQEPQDTSSSFSWSFSASSIDSHSSLPAGGSPLVPRSMKNGQESGFSSQEHLASSPPRKL
ncbi:hypothetical protein C0Q70_05633 [Pomacea canaliculata]|uniref:Serine/threonine-protein kinase PLK4 n=1 Tax=Pomacea canaliculata TaxID=400727 RepID=A0A2T7PLU3_POMCA|nr:hypothetical protein C0Q70_05633 [Pomacea canaliculata]